jgi:hypothetical protein
LKPLFDKNSKHVAWIDNDGYIFNTQMHWCGFIDSDFVFSPRSKYLGFYIEESIVDRNGNAVAHITDSYPISISMPPVPPIPPSPPAPSIPHIPSNPPAPPFQTTPIGGWSALSWINFINQV